MKWPGAGAPSTSVERAYRRGDLFERRRRLMADGAAYCAAPGGTTDVVGGAQIGYVYGFHLGVTPMSLSPADLRGICLYSDRELDSIIKAAGGKNVCRESLARLLSTALLGYTQLLRGKEIIKRRDWEGKKYKKLQECCSALLDAIDDLGDCCDAGNPMNLDNVRQLVQQSHDWAQWQSGLRSKAESTRGRDWRSSDFAMDGWIKFLADIYRLVFGKQPGFSINDGKVTGPFARYIDACIRPVLGSAPPPEALRSRWQRLIAERSDPSGQCP